jgi:L-lactate dehydrogenase complex protein LldG
LADVPAQENPTDVVVTRDYLQTHGERTAARTADLLAENLADYRAKVHRCSVTEIGEVIARLLDGVSAVLVPTGLPENWLLATEATRIPDAAELTASELDDVDCVVTSCAVAIAETGTIVLDGTAGMGRRRITLVPDRHICVVLPQDIVDSVPQGLSRLIPQRPQTWISGPSATSDIELDRVEGVHGPRVLEVLVCH